MPKICRRGSRLKFIYYSVCLQLNKLSVLSFLWEAKVDILGVVGLRYGQLWLLCWWRATVDFLEVAGQGTLASQTKSILISDQYWSLFIRERTVHRGFRNTHTPYSVISRHLSLNPVIVKGVAQTMVYMLGIRSWSLNIPIPMTPMYCTQNSCGLKRHKFCSPASLEEGGIYYL